MTEQAPDQASLDGEQEPVPSDPPRAESAARCFHCGAELAPEQDWCLECGTAARTRIVPPPSWRGPVAIVALVVLLAGAGIALAFVEVTDQGGAPTKQAAAPTAPAAASPPPATGNTTTPGATTTPSGPASARTSPAPSTTPNPAASAKTSALRAWPKGVSAYTVVLLSSAKRSGARKTARALSAAGLVGVARSDDFSNVPAGAWLVFAGHYKSHAQAQAAAAAVKQRGATLAYVQYLIPKRH